jgi:hypothetical protein
MVFHFPPRCTQPQVATASDILGSADAYRSLRLRGSRKAPLEVLLVTSRLLTLTMTLAVLAACGGTQPSPPISGLPIPADASLRAPLHTRSGSGGYVFVSNHIATSATEIEYWLIGATGNVAPAGIIAGSNTGLDGGVQQVVVDPSGEIYVAVGDADTILGFAPGSSGNVSPNIVINGSNTGLAKPIGLALDASGNLWVANCSAAFTFGCPSPPDGQPSIEAFAPGSNGNAVPIRLIAGERTGLIAPFSIAIGKNGDIYLLDSANPPSEQSVIDVFGRNANGDARPKQQITGPLTFLNQAYGLAVNRRGIYTDTWKHHYIERFGLKDNGDARPATRIKGPLTELGCCLDGMAGAPDGTIYVADRNGDQTGQAIQQYAELAHGNASPLTMITGSNTGLVEPIGVFAWENL